MQASASAKIILMGEHAVVYGTPSIAMPITELRAWAEVNPAEQFQIEALDTGQTIRLGGNEPLARLAELSLQALKADVPQVRISLRADIPIASGLGSGAALSTALARAIALACGRDWDVEVLNNVVYQVEKLYHGTPSGVDNTVIVYEKPIWFVRQRPIETLDVGTDFHFVVADTGIPAPTYESVGAVRRLLETKPEYVRPIIDNIGYLTEQARSCLARGEAEELGHRMNANQECLRQLTVSSDELENLIRVARNHGALGAKLSGGGRGGNMLALVFEQDAEKIRLALLSAGARRAFVTRLARTGERKL
ncbi:MAG: mevalonate kinase [Anaerolineae bacterium]|nr:mevalonate kinase [Anaerolineae bacterium]